VPLWRLQQLLHRRPSHLRTCRLSTSQHPHGDSITLLLWRLLTQQLVQPPTGNSLSESLDLFWSVTQLPLQCLLMSACDPGVRSHTRPTCDFSTQCCDCRRLLIFNSIQLSRSTSHPCVFHSIDLSSAATLRAPRRLRPTHTTLLQPDLTDLA